MTVQANRSTATAADRMHIERLVDNIGELKARLAPDLAALVAMEKRLKGFGPGRYKGLMFEGNVFTGERNTLDMDAVREKLTPQFIRAHTTTSETITLKVTARQLGAEALAS